MNLEELRERARWACDEVTTNASELIEPIVNQLINDALRELSPYLHILTSATPTFTAGVASLPSNFISPVYVYDGDTLLDEVTDIDDIVETTDDTSQYMIPNNTQIKIYGITPTDTVTLWYNAYADELDADADEPDEVPKRYHRGLAEYYVPWKLADKLSNDDLADRYEAKWNNFCADVEYATTQGRLANPPTVKAVW